MASNKLSLIARSFSTSNASQQLVRPPIQIFGIEGRYATALYSAASKEGKLENVEKELNRFQKATKTDIKLREFMENPSYKRSLKSNALKAIAEAGKLSSLSSNLLQLLADNGRLKKTNQIINAYKVLMAAHRGEVTCEVTTASVLDGAQKSKLEGVLKKFVKKNESILLTTKVDPSILGGIVISIGDRYADMSVATKIKKYTDIISATV